MEHLTQPWCYDKCIVWPIMLTNCPQLSTNSQNNLWIFIGSENSQHINYAM